MEWWRAQGRSRTPGPKRWNSEGQGRSWWLKMLLENRNSVREIGIGRINGLVVGEGTLDSAMLGVCQNNLFFLSSSHSMKGRYFVSEDFFIKSESFAVKYAINFNLQPWHLFHATLANGNSYIIKTPNVACICAWFPSLGRSSWNSGGWPATWSGSWWWGEFSGRQSFLWSDFSTTKDGWKNAKKAHNKVDEWTSISQCITVLKIQIWVFADSSNSWALFHYHIFFANPDDSILLKGTRWQGLGRICVHVCVFVKAFQNLEIVCQNHSLITDTELIIGQDRLIRTADRQWIDIDTDRIR